MNEKKDEQSEFREFLKRSERMTGNKLLSFYVFSLVKATEAQTLDHGKWQAIQARILRDGLAAIALAASTPEDNWKEVEATILKLAASEDVLQTAIDNAPK